MTILSGVYQYLIDRNVSADLYNDRIVISRGIIDICMYANDANIEIIVERPLPNRRGRRVSNIEDAAIFNITDPNSLQMIYEYIMSINEKVNRRQKHIASKIIEMRLAQKMNVPIITATQTNYGGIE